MASANVFDLTTTTTSSSSNNNRSPTPILQSSSTTIPPSPILNCDTNNNNIETITDALTPFIIGNGNVNGDTTEAKMNGKDDAKLNSLDAEISDSDHAATNGFINKQLELIETGEVDSQATIDDCLQLPGVRKSELSFKQTFEESLATGPGSREEMQLPNCDVNLDDLSSMEPEFPNGDDKQLEGSLEDSSTSFTDFDQDCKICQKKLQSPRVLACLHVFCEYCLNKLLLRPTPIIEDGSGDAKTVRPAVDLECPACQQKTRVGAAGAASLHNDYVLTNIVDLSAIDLSSLACTSCKGKERAISRCNDCANILCASCDNAHQYMRCFENHKVIRLEDLVDKLDATTLANEAMDSQSQKQGAAIHKPMYCNSHPVENLRYYCRYCCQPVCNECLIGEHKGGDHNYELIGEAERQVRGDLERLMADAQMKVNNCDEATHHLESALMELQTQHDTARDLIVESYQSFKAVLECCRDGALKELDSLHSERELKIMEALHGVEKSSEGIERAAKFTSRILTHCNGPEMLSLNKLITAQFAHLSTIEPKTESNYSIEFQSKFEQFKQLASDAFGRFRTESSAQSPKESTPPPTLPGMPPISMTKNQQYSSIGGGPGGDGNRTANNMLSMNGNLMNLAIVSRHQQQQPQQTPHSGFGFNHVGVSQSQGALTNSVTASSPISLPTSMQSSFDGDLSGLGINTNQPPPPTPLLNGTNVSHPPPNLGQFGPLMNGNNVGGNNVHSPPLMDQPPPSMAPPNAVNNVAPLGGPSSQAPGGLTSIAEYNIQQLANLVEQTTGTGTDLSDNMMSPPVGRSVTSGQGHIILADILSGDPHALNNFQVWSKLGLNHPLSRGPSPGVDNLLLNDFSAISAANGDDMLLTNFNGSGPNGSQQSGGSSIGVPSRNKSAPMQIRCKFGSLGPSKAQFNSPHGFCLGVDEEIIVADTNNHRIEVFEKTGAFKFQFGVPGKDEGQLWYPRKVAVMRPSYKFVVCDRGNERSRMQIFNKAGHFMKKIAIRYIDIVAGLAVTNQGHIVAVDSVSPTVFVISEEGELIHWFDCSDYMREPSDIAISGSDFYVCDFKGHCVAVFGDDGTFKYRIGNEKITCFPNGIDISDAGDILIGDSHGNRFHVACYSREGVLQSEYECPHVKVSRCCGLKITSEGFVVTLAKNNHHVLVLNTLYIQ